MTRYYVSTALPTVLAADLGASGSPSVISLPGTWPTSYPFAVLLDWGTSSQEAILVTSAPTGTGPYTLPCTRGIDLTTAQAHNAGAQAEHGTTGYEPTLIQANAASIAALESGSAGAVLLAGDLGNIASAPEVISTHLASPLPVNQGGTGTGTGAGQNDVFAGPASGGSGAPSFRGLAAADVPATLNATTLPVTDSGGQVFNVKAYGATGNGSTADDSAIQSAISAAVAAGGGIVWFPKGNYKLVTGLTMSSKVILRGAGPLVSILRPASGVTAITAAGTSGAQITQTVYEDIGITGVGQGTGSAPGMSLTWCTTGTRLSRLYIELCGTDGIIASNSYSVSMRDCFLVSNGGNGLNAQVNINSWDMSGNTSLLNTQWGYYIMGGVAGILHDCDAESNGYGGAAILGTFSWTVEGGEYENNGASGSGQECGIYLGSGSGSYTTAHNTILRGNWLQGSSVANYGIVVDGADLTLIDSNGFQNNLTNDIKVTANATGTRLGVSNFFSTPGSGNIADAGTGTQQTGYDSTNAVMRSSGLSFGTTTGAADVTLTRAAAGRLLLSAATSSGQLLKILNSSASTSVPNLYLSGTTTTDLAVGSVYSGLSFLPWTVTHGGKISWGSGSANPDTALLRSAAGVLQVTSALSAAGLTGATAASRYVGATASGAPASGTFAVGDFVIDQTGTVWICTAAGSPGTWASPSGGGGGVTIDTTAADIQPLGTQAAGSKGEAADAEHVHASPQLSTGPGDIGYAAWNADPLLSTLSVTLTSFPVAGNVAVARVDVRTAVTISNIWVYWVKPSGGSPANNYLALFNSSGTQVGSTTSDMTSTTSGLQGFSIGSEALSIGTYYVAYLCGTQGSTQGGLAYLSVANSNIGGISNAFVQAPQPSPSAAHYRFARNGTGASGMPGSLTLSSNSLASLYPFWCALL